MLYHFQTYVPGEDKDDKYWERREKNNMAARRSREVRKESHRTCHRDIFYQYYQQYRTFLIQYKKLCSGQNYRWRNVMWINECWLAWAKMGFAHSPIFQSRPQVHILVHLTFHRLYKECCEEATNEALKFLNTSRHAVLKKTRLRCGRPT